MSLHASPGECFILDSRLATFLGERNCAFAFLLVVVCDAVTILFDFDIKCVLLSLWCLGRKVLGY